MEEGVWGRRKEEGDRGKNKAWPSDVGVVGPVGVRS